MTAHEQELMHRQRAARLAKEAEDKERKRKEAALHGGSAKDFWDLVDTSGGMDSCHPWKGEIDHTWT